MPSPPPADIKTALVTGGAIRVGRAIVEGLLADGYRVWVHCHTSVSAAADLARASDRVPGVLCADLRTDDGRRDLAAGVGDRLDLLVNSAASFERGSFEHRDSAALRRVLELNLVAPLDLTRRCLRALRAAQGNVVNILDTGGTHPWKHYLDHCVAKSALKTATEALAAELAPLRVNGVAPGTVQWPTGGPAEDRDCILAKIPRGTIGSGADVAQAVCFLARSPHISGHTLTVDGGTLAGIAGWHGAPTAAPP